MECLSFKSEIKNTFSTVRTFSFNQKKTPILDEETTNKFLDAILEFKESLIVKTSSIYDINDKIEKLTWYSNLSEDSLLLINDLISAAKDLHSSLIRQYVSFNTFRKNAIALNEIKDFKNSIDELKETYSDLESVFFYLPEMPEFKDTTKLLSLV